MTGVGLEVLLEDLIPEIALSGDKGVPLSSLLKIVRQYHNSVNGQETASDGDAGSSLAPAQDAQDGPLEASFSEPEMKSARWAWDWLRKQSQITFNQDQDKRYKALQLDDVLALPEADDTPTEAVVDGADDAQQAPPPKPTPASKKNAKEKNAKGKESKKPLTHRPRIYPTEELLWQTIAHHGADYKRIPVLEWKCLVGIASSRHEGILQSDLRRLVDQDKRSLPKRTDSLAKKGYIAKRTIIANKMKTSKLWLLRFAPVEPENTKTSSGLELAPETLTMNLDPVPWHVRWTGDGVDVEAHARTIVAIVKAWGVLRYCDLRSKMGVGGQTARMKTLAKACQRWVDMGVLKYTAAAFAGARKIFKDCLKFIREPTTDEWQEFLATGKKTSVYSDASRHRQPKGSALALTGKPGQSSTNKNSTDKNQGPLTTIQVFPGWSPDAPLTQFVFEVVRSAGPTGASNPQVSIATIGYSFRRYMASLLAKLAEANQPPHLKKFKVESKLVRSGKTSAYMFSVPNPLTENGESAAQTASDEPVKQGASANTAIGSRRGFGAIKAKAFPNAQALSLSELCKPVKRPAAYQRRRGGMISEAKRAAMDVASRSSVSRTVESTPVPEVQLREAVETTQVVTPEAAAAERQRLANIPITGPPGAFLGEPGSLHPKGRGRRRPAKTIVVVIRLQKLKDPLFWESLHLKPVDVGSLDVRFNGIAGKLELDSSGEAIKFVAAGESEEVPLTVRIDSLMGVPFIQDEPTSSDKSLVLVTATTDEEGPSRTHAFHFDSDQDTFSKAVAFQQKISDKKPVAIAPQPTPTTVAPARGGARGGRGRGGRGGTKGRGGKKSQAGGAVFKCETCGGTWRNDIGLKYHLTKAQTPCNPDFDPASLLEKARKRRQATLAPPISSGPSSVAGDDESTGRAAKRRKQKHIARAQAYAMVRSAMRGRPNIEQAFRGFIEEESESDGDQPIVPSRELAPTDTGAVPAKHTGTSALGTGPHQPASNASGSRYLPPAQSSGLYVSSAIKPATWDSSTPTAPAMAASKSKQKAKTKAAVDTLTKEQPAIHEPQAQPSSLIPLETVSTTTPSSYQGEFSGFNGRKVLGLLDLLTNRGAGLSPSEDHSDYPPLRGDDDEQNANLNTSANAPTHDVGSTTSHQELSEFTPSYSYDRLQSESKKRTAQAVDIIQYLLDNNNGVFPGDKALFYALTKVFLREFMNAVPPTWKNFHAAMRILESQKLAMIHTHMLHDNGRRHACTMFVRTGVDPNGPIATAMRQKMKDVYPSIYIPPAFSPTMEELAILEELDRKPDERDRADRGKQKEGATGEKQNRNGNKFRSRRKIDEVEVFNAPYYTQNQVEPTPPPMDANSYFPLPTKDTELTASPGTPRKRPATAEPPAESPSTKRQRLQYNKTLELNIDPILSRSPTGPGANRRDDNSEPRRAFKTQAGLPGTGVMGTEPRSVVDAIRTYGLLPSRTGRRKRRDSMTVPASMGKIPSELGWARNPGLSSLPQSFWGNMEPLGGRPREGQASVRFLAPNTHLGDEAGGEGAGGEDERPSVVINNKPPAEVLPIDPALVNVDEHNDQQANACVFVNPTTLGDSAPGIWSGLDLHFFELNQEASFALRGWMPDRVKLLLENLPKSAEEMGKRNRGQPWKVTDSWLDQEWARFWLSVSRIKTWELSQHGSNLLLLGGSIAPEHIYINVSPSVERSCMKPATLQWSEDTQYTLDTLPYEYLDDDDDMTDISYVWRMPKKVGRPKKVVEPKQRKRQRIAQVTEKTMGMVRGSKFKLPAIKTGRELTAFPRSEEDFLRAPGDDSLQLDWTSENVKLTAFVVVTTLVGGVDRIVDWGLMLRLFPDLTISQLRHLWGDLKKDRQSTIVNLTEKFRKAYLKSYDELPTLDYNNTAAYDWKSLIKWALKLDNTQRADIPASRQEVQTKYNLEDCQYANREWRESYYHPQRSVFNRFQDASSDALACPAEPTPAAPTDRDMIVALSWTRSLCVTPIDTYPTDMVIKRRESLYPRLRRADVTALIMKGIMQLQKEGIVSRSTSKFSNGRRWRFNNRVPDLLEKVAQVDKLTKAVAFKRELDAAFRTEPRQQRVTYVTNDGMMLALLNMQACGRIRILTTGQPNVPLGHEPGNYETRKYTKRYIHFRVDMVPTETYLFDDEPALASFRDRLRAAEPPSEGPGGAIPVWCDVFSKVDGGRWLRYLAAVLLTLASRGSMRADELVKTLKPTMMLFEAELILDWAAKLDLLEPQLEGLAPAVKEWWWMALEAQQERLNKGKPRKMLPGARPGGEKKPGERRGCTY